MGLFGSSKKDNCAICGKEVELSFFTSTGIEIANNKVICCDCVKKYAVDTSKPKDVTLESVLNKVHSVELIKNGDFVPSKTIHRLSCFGGQTNNILLQIDEKSGLINIPAFVPRLFKKDIVAPNIRPTYKIMKFLLIEKYNVIVDDNRASRAMIGRMLCGRKGARIGASTATKNVHKLVQIMKIKVTFDDIINPVEYIDLITPVGEGVVVGIRAYMIADNVAQECISLLNVLIERNKRASANVKISAADEILKFKKLLDMGVITQKEFEAKKKILLKWYYEKDSALKFKRGMNL